MGYIRSMKTQFSIRMDEEVLAIVDERCKKVHRTRSNFIEWLVLYAYQDVEPETAEEILDRLEKEGKVKRI